MRLSDTIIKKILELRARGLGYKRIASSLCREASVCISYKTVERVLRYFSGVKVTSDSEDTCHFRAHIISSDNSEDGLGVSDDGVLVRLGKTQKLVLSVMSREPFRAWSPSVIVFEIYRLYRRRVSRKAVWSSLRRLEKRGLVFRVRGRNYILPGEYMDSAWYLNTRVFGLGPDISVHNLRVFNVTVVREVNGLGVGLVNALFEASRMGLTYPVSEVELGYDYYDPRLYDELREKGFTLFKVYLKKNRPGWIRIEALLSKPDLVAEVRFIDEWRNVYQQIISGMYYIVGYEASRIGLVSRGEQLVVGVGSRLAA